MFVVYGVGNWYVLRSISKLFIQLEQFSFVNLAKFILSIIRLATFIYSHEQILRRSFLCDGQHRQSHHQQSLSNLLYSSFYRRLSRSMSMCSSCYKMNWRRRATEIEPKPTFSHSPSVWMNWMPTCFDFHGPRSCVPRKKPKNLLLSPVSHPYDHGIHICSVCRSTAFQYLHVHRSSMSTARR